MGVARIIVGFKSINYLTRISTFALKSVCTK